jgi:hypothetical protein
MGTQERREATASDAREMRRGVNMEEVFAVEPDCQAERIADKRGWWFPCEMFITDKYAYSVPVRVLVYEHYRSHHPGQYEQRTLMR